MMLILNLIIIKSAFRLLTMKIFLPNLINKYYNILYAYHTFIKEID